MHFTPFATMNTPVIIPHVQYHTWKGAHLCTRDPLPTRRNTICTYQAFYLPAGGRRGIFTAKVCGYLRQHHLQLLCFAGSETPLYFSYTHFVSFTCERSVLSQEILTPAPWHTSARAQTSPLYQKDCGKPGGLRSQKLIPNSLYRHIHLDRQCSSNTYIDIDRLLSQG